MFEGLSSITFDKLGLRVEVYRKQQIADIVVIETGQEVGQLWHHPERYLEWVAVNGFCGPCPKQIWDTVGSMFCVEKKGYLERKTMFEGLSSITFDKLRLHVQVSRSERTACVLTPDHRDVWGVLTRKAGGCVEWYPTQPQYKLPVEVLDTVATMI